MQTLGCNREPGGESGAAGGGSGQRDKGAAVREKQEGAQRAANARARL